MSVFLAACLTLWIALLWLRTMDWVAQRGWVESRLSRKIIHIGTGPMFVLCWLLFPSEPSYGRYLAALVPLLFTVQFALIGLGIVNDEASVKAMSRNGDRREILRGPLFYGIVFVIMTIVYWKDSPMGMTALMLMCGGDGLAKILGQRLPSSRLPWNKGNRWPARQECCWEGGDWLCLSWVCSCGPESSPHRSLLTCGRSRSSR